MSQVSLVRNRRTLRSLRSRVRHKIRPILSLANLKIKTALRLVTKANSQKLISLLVLRILRTS
ncbi:hypothetical protein D3C85_1872190 [compost metagenome]|jgi:hypothetical protein